MGQQLRCISRDQHTLGGIPNITPHKRNTRKNKKSNESTNSSNSKSNEHYLIHETSEEGPKNIKRLMDSISVQNQENSINLDHAYQAIYDPNVEANWLELQLQTQILSPENGYYEYTLKICQELGQNEPFQHEIFKWQETEDLEGSKVKNLKFPFKFKYLSCFLQLEIFSSYDRVKTPLFNACVNFEELFRSGINFKWLKPKKSYTCYANNKVELLLREHRVAQKTLISFCINIPLEEEESIFKNSRLMLHEVADDEWQQVNQQQRFEVVKITRCKMRQKDVLEIELGLKNIVLKNKQFEDRVFVLKFLDKLDPQLACKGKILIKGEDILKLQQMQFIELQQTFEETQVVETTPHNKKKITSQRNTSNSGCFVTSHEVVKIAKDTEKKKKQKPVKNETSFGVNTNSTAKVEEKLVTAQGQEKVCYIVGPLNFDQTQFSIMGLIPDFIHVSPVICMDFSLANLTFQSNGICVHTPNPSKHNQYRDLFNMIARDVFSEETYIPIFGFGAKTFSTSSEVSHIFPLSQSMTNPLIPNNEDSLSDTYNDCLKKLKIDLPVKVVPTLLFLKNLALMVREKQEKQFISGESIVQFPQIFYQCQILTTGIIDDIEDVLKVFENNQWACLPIQITFINVYLKNIQENDLDSLRLRDSVNKYNDEVAGWKQIQIKFLQRKDIDLQIQEIAFELSSQISKNIEDYLFVNQLVNKQDFIKLSNFIKTGKTINLGCKKQLIQQSQKNWLDIMEQQNNKLYANVKKKIGIQRNVFDAIIQSQGDMFEWSVEACLNAAAKHDKRVIEEAQSVDEQTELDISQLHVSQMNRTIVGPNDPVELNEEPEQNSFLEEFKNQFGYQSEYETQVEKKEASMTPISNANTAETQIQQN